MKQCTYCRIEKPIEDFYHFKGRPLSLCKECNNLKSKQWQQANRQKKNATNKNWRANNADRIKVLKSASNAIAAALRRGDIERACMCEQCGSQGFMEAAHYDYDKPMEIRWLCRKCHRRWDTNDPKSKKKLRSHMGATE